MLRILVGIVDRGLVNDPVDIPSCYSALRGCHDASMMELRS